MDHKVSPEALRYALDRVKAFAQVNFVRSQDEKVDSVPLFWEAVGVDEATLDEFYILTRDLVSEKNQGAFMFGVVFGLFVREFDAA